MSDSPADIADANGVLLNKLGINDSEQLSAVEYETTRRRSAAILNEEALAHLQGFGLERLQAIHRYLFEPVYEWAGNLREMASAKDIPGTPYTGVFTAPSRIADDWKDIEQATGQFVAAQGLSYEQKLDALIDIFVAANNSHPFLEGNGRALQVFMTQLALEQGIRLNFSMATDNPALKSAWNHASAMSSVYGVLVEDDTPGENWVLSQVIPPDRAELANYFRYIASEIPPKQEISLGHTANRDSQQAGPQTALPSSPKILINVIGSPGAGKTYWAQAIAQALGGTYVSEYATHLIRQGRAELLADQVLTTGGQMGLVMDGFRNSNIVVSDSPGALGFIYCSKPADLPAVHRLVEGTEKGAHVITVLVRHNKASLEAFSMDGRLHNKEQSLAVQKDILLMLDGKKTFEGVRNGEPFFFTPEAKQYITVERGNSLNELVEQIKHQIQQLPAFQQSQHTRSKTTMTQAAPNSNDTADCLSDLTKCLDLIQTSGRLVTATPEQQPQYTDADEEFRRKYSGTERFPDVVTQMLDTSIADRVVAPTELDALGAGTGAQQAIKIAQKHFFGGSKINVGMVIKARVSETVQSARESLANNEANDEIRGFTVLRDALNTADVILDELRIPNDRQELVKAFIQNEWSKNAEQNDKVRPIQYALNLSRSALSEQVYNPDLQMARAVMINSLMAHPERIGAGLAHAYYIKHDESRQHYTKEELAQEASKYTKDLPKVQNVMTVLNAALDAAAMAYHETEQAKLISDLKGLHDRLSEKGGKRFLNNDSIRLLALIRAENEKNIPITRPNLDNVSVISGFNVVDWKTALSAESRMQTIKAAADIAQKYGVDFKHENRMIVGRALDGQDAFFRDNYDAPTAVVRMLLPKEQFKKLCEAHKALAAAEAEVAKAGTFVISPEAIQAHQARSRCSEALRALHTEALATFQKAANEHYVALVKDRTSYFERLGQAQFGVPIRHGHGQEGVDSLAKAHERVLRGVCQFDVDAKVIDAYQPAANAAFHETNCGVPDSVTFSAMPFPLEDDTARPTAQATATAKPPAQRQDQTFSPPKFKAG